jgi:hypothetical protein
MKHNNRELFLYRIIYGIVRSKVGKNLVKIYPPTTEVYLESCELFFQEMDNCYTKGIMDEEEMIDWMIENDLWSWHEEKEIEGIKNKQEELKLFCYNNRRNKMLLNSTKNTIRAIEDRYRQLIIKKKKYFHNTCEGISSMIKISHIVKNSCFVDGKLTNNIDFHIDNLIFDYNKFHDIDDSIIRFLSRTDPWRNIWNLRKNINRKLFPSIDSTRELTINQKSLIAWSQMYDNVYESYDSPCKDVIEDDDILDGWFIFQSKKRETEKSQSDLDNSIKSDKIKNSQEIFSVVSSKEEADKIDSLNNAHSKMIKKQRETLIRNKGGSVDQSAFADEKLKLLNQSNKQFKGKFGK